MQRLKSDTGLTLLELAIAILVLSIGALAAVRASDQSRVSIGGAQDRVLAQLAARNHAEALRIPAAAATLPDTVTLNGLVFTLTTATKPTAGGLREVTISARSERGQGAVLVVYLPGGSER